MLFSNVKHRSYFCKDLPLRLCDCITTTTTRKRFFTNKLGFQQHPAAIFEREEVSKKKEDFSGDISISVCVRKLHNGNEASDSFLQRFAIDKFSCYRILNGHSSGCENCDLVFRCSARL